MQQTWQTQESLNQLNHVTTDTMQEGVQNITPHGIEATAVFAIVEDRKLIAPRKKLSQFFHDSPLTGVELDLSRNSDL